MNSNCFVGLFCVFTFCIWLAVFGVLCFWCLPILVVHCSLMMYVCVVWLLSFVFFGVVPLVNLVCLDCMILHLLRSLLVVMVVCRCCVVACLCHLLLLFEV